MEGQHHERTGSSATKCLSSRESDNTQRAHIVDEDCALHGSNSPRDEVLEQSGANVGSNERTVLPSDSFRRAIFTDEEDDQHGFYQVFSADATVASVEATMQPKVVETQRGRPPLRARRVLNLMDRLGDAGDKDSSLTERSAAEALPPNMLPSQSAIGAQRKRPCPQTNDDEEKHCAGDRAAASAVVTRYERVDDDSTLIIQRKWKRRLPESKPTDSEELLIAPPPQVRPTFGRSLSSHSVFLSRPRMTLNPSSGSGGQVSASNNRPHELVLPTIRSSSHPDLNVISPHTVASLLQGDFNNRLDSFTLIDCRFEYEFEGGSLQNALSMNSPAQVEDRFLSEPPVNSTKQALIFFCEFSANRAPKMLRHVRNLDRWIHAERYPELFYPELYLIDGGYKNCFMTLKDAICCQPPSYRPMNDKDFVDQCKRDFAIHRANWKQHKSTSCASKFQQLHRRIHESATAASDSEDAIAGDEDLIARPTTLRSFSQQC